MKNKKDAFCRDGAKKIFWLNLIMRLVLGYFFIFIVVKLTDDIVGYLKCTECAGLIYVYIVKRFPPLS